MTREEAKEFALKEIEKCISKEGENAIFAMSPKTGKCSWTYKEAKESILKDECLESTNNNLIDMVLDYENYKNKRSQ